MVITAARKQLMDNSWIYNKLSRVCERADARAPISFVDARNGTNRYKARSTRVFLGLKPSLAFTERVKAAGAFKHKTAASPVAVAVVDT